MAYKSDSLTGTTTAITDKYLCSISDVVNYVDSIKNDLTVSSSVTSVIGTYIGIVSSFFEHECNTVLKLQNLYGVYDSDGSDELELNSRVYSVNSIKSRSNPTLAWTNIFTTGSTATNLFIYGSKIKLYNFSFTYGNQTTEVNYVGGWPDVELEMLKKPTIEEVALMYYESKKSGEARLGITNKSMPLNPGENVGFNATDIIARNQIYLKKFKRRTI